MLLSSLCFQTTDNYPEAGQLYLAREGFLHLFPWCLNISALIPGQSTSGCLRLQVHLKPAGLEPVCQSIFPMSNQRFLKLLTLEHRDTYLLSLLLYSERNSCKYEPGFHTDLQPEKQFSALDKQPYLLH